MNSSTLPPLLGDYPPNLEHKQAVASTRSESDQVAPINDQLEHVKNGSNEVERKPKHTRTVMAHRRHAEAEEKASKEREEKLHHTLKMWNIVKENERKRKHRMLKERVNLQHQMIKKQDELIQGKHEQQDKELKKQTAKARSQKQTFLVPQLQKVQHEAKPSRNRTKMCEVIMKPVAEEAPPKTCIEDKQSEASQKDAFSEEDLSELLEMSTIQDADFQELRFQPLQAQLERLFGNEADGYLNPTVKENPRKVFDLSLARKKGHHGAEVLWGALRAYSRQKLINKDALILPDVKNAYACFVRECLRRHVTPVKRNFVSEEETPVNINVEESDILKDVRFRRHRQELMYRIAHINKDKTRLLFQVIGQPHYSEENDEDGIRKYYPEVTEVVSDEKPPVVVKLPEIHDKSRSTLGQSVATANTQSETKATNENDTQPRVGGSKLVFLTEKKATCRGQFSKRLNKAEKEVNLNSKYSKVEDTACTSKTPTPVFSQRLWEPLTMQALLDHHQVSVFERRNEITGRDSSQMWNVCS